MSQKYVLGIKNTSPGPSLYVLKMIINALTAKQDEMYKPVNKHREANIFPNPLLLATIYFGNVRIQ